jgi:hypothetical protein
MQFRGRARNAPEQQETDAMEINFRHDVDAVLAEAKELQKPVLLDFSAAPM